MYGTWHNLSFDHFKSTANVLNSSQSLIRDMTHHRKCIKHNFTRSPGRRSEEQKEGSVCHLWSLLEVEDEIQTPVAHEHKRSS